MPLTHFPHGIGTSIVVPGGGGLISTGIGIGDIKWVVPAKSSTDKWYERIRQIANDSDIFTTLVEAHAACVGTSGTAGSGQGDTIFIAPGRYDVIAETDFYKSNIQVVGLCGPNNLLSVAASTSSRSMPACTLHTATAAVGNVIHVYGSDNQFYNISAVNGGANAGNLSALCVGRITTNTAQRNYFNRCTFHGCMSTSQNTIANCSVEIGSGSSCYMFEDCIIGQNTFGGARETSYQGHLYYSGTGASGAAAGVGPQNGIFRNCLFLSRTASSTTVPMVRIGYNSATPTGMEEIDRDHIFDGCRFISWGGASNGTVFDINIAGGPGRVILTKSSAFGYAEWRVARASQVGDSVGLIWADMPVSNATDAGIAIEPTA